MSYVNVFDDIMQNQDLSPFGYIALIGSMNPEHDLDLVTIGNGQPTGEFLANQTTLINAIVKALNEYGIKAVPFTKQCYQDEVEWISKGGLMIHNITYSDLEAFNKLNPPGFIEKMNEGTIFNGSLDALEGIQVQQGPNDYLAYMLQDANIVNCPYPKELMIKKTQKMINYVRKWLNLNEQISLKTKDECLEALIKCFKNIN